MRGFPTCINTKEDVLHLVNFCKNNGQYRGQFVSWLKGVKTKTTMYVLKAESSKKPEIEITEDDFNIIPDPSCTKNKLGLTDEEIDTLIEEVSQHGRD